MTAIANTPSKVSQAQFDHYKKELDLNHDGKIDKADAQMAEQQAGDARVKGGLSMLIPIAGWIAAGAEFKKAGEFDQKAKQIRNLISKQPDASLDQNDVRKRTCNRSYRKGPDTSTDSTQAQRTSYRSSLPGTEGLKEEITAEWRQAGQDIAGLREKIRNCKDKDEKQMLMMDLQEKMNEQARFMELLNKIQKQSHDTQMSIIRNIA